MKTSWTVVVWIPLLTTNRRKMWSLQLRPSMGIKKLATGHSWKQNDYKADYCPRSWQPLTSEEDSTDMSKLEKALIVKFVTWPKWKWSSTGHQEEENIVIVNGMFVRGTVVPIYYSYCSSWHICNLPSLRYGRRTDKCYQIYWSEICPINLVGINNTAKHDFQ